MKKGKFDIQKVVAANVGGMAGAAVNIASNMIIDQVKPDLSGNVRAMVQVGAMEVIGGAALYFGKPGMVQDAGLGMLGAAGYKAGMTLYGAITMGSPEPTVQGTNEVLNAPQRKALDKLRNLTAMRKKGAPGARLQSGAMPQQNARQRPAVQQRSAGNKRRYYGDC